MIVATFTRTRTIAKCNIRTRSGRHAPQERTYPEGMTLVVVNEFTSSGMATHGDKCYTLRDTPRMIMIRACEVTTREIPDLPYWEYERGWDTAGNCTHCGEAGRCRCQHPTIQKRLS